MYYVNPTFKEGTSYKSNFINQTLLAYRFPEVVTTGSK